MLYRKKYTKYLSYYIFYYKIYKYFFCEGSKFFTTHRDGHECGNNKIFFQYFFFKFKFNSLTIKLGKFIS